jgi:type IV pilus assembly protein PilW
MTRAMSERRQAGFSLVELMVGMVLGLMLIAGAVSIYLASKRSYVEVEQVAALTENARFAEQIVGDSLRHMGFFGEAPASEIRVDAGLVAPAGDCNVPAEAGAYHKNSAGFIQRLGFAATADSSGDALDCITDAVPNTDVLVIKHALPRPYSDGPRGGKDPNEPLDNDGVIDTPDVLLDGKTYVMTNNVGGLLFDGGSPPSINSGGEVPNGVAWEYQYEVFYVRDGDVPQLARRVLSYDPDTLSMTFKTEDLAEGVERLYLLFGYDNNNDGEVDTYKNLASIGSNIAGIQSVEVFMLVRSATEDVQYTNNKTYALGRPVPVGPFNDHYRRLVSHTSMSLRNLKLILRRDA